MKIEVNPKRDMVEFGDLNEGEIFKQGNDYYLKTSDRFFYNNTEHNAILLEYGDFVYFSSEEKIEIVKATLVIDD